MQSTLGAAFLPALHAKVPNEEIPKILPELNGWLLKLIQEEEEGDSISDYVSPELSTDFWISGQTDYVHCNEKNLREPG